MSTLIDDAARAAEKVLAVNISPLGMMASSAGYPQVWARDSVLTLLGAALGRDATALECYRVSLETLARHQSRFGQIPGFVDCKTGDPMWGTMDPNPWFVIGAAHYLELTGDASFAGRVADAVTGALDWCEMMDVNHEGLMLSPEMGDWADLLAHHGHVLFPNVLCVAALGRGAGLLEAAGRTEAAAGMRRRRDAVREAIRDWFWVKDPQACEDKSHFQVRKLAAIHLRRRPFFLPWVDVADYGEHFDAAGNLLAILAGVADGAQAGAILDYIDQAGVNRPYPVQAIYPPIQPGDRHWREYYKIFNCNLPHQYHNGGIWPWLGGAYVAALVKAGRPERAAAELGLLAEAVRLHKGADEWEFNEWLQGQTGRPMGAPVQAWSAGMFLYARHAVRTGETPGWDA